MARASLFDCLPEVFTSACLPGSPLAALVAAADGMLQPASTVLDSLDARVDPFRAPPAMVAYLAGWVDLAWLTLPDQAGASRSSLPLGSAPLRDLVSTSAELAASRGTVDGLVRFLELATRVIGFSVEEAGLFHVRVLVPEEARGQAEAIARIVAMTKPGHVTAEVVLPEDADVPETTDPEPASAAGAP